MVKFKWKWDDTLKEFPEESLPPPTKETPPTKEKEETHQQLTKKHTNGSKGVPPSEPQEETTNETHQKKNNKKKSKETQTINVYITPTIQKLTSETKDPKVVKALEQLQKVLVDVETTKPGTTHKLIQRIVETLRK